MEYDAGRNFLHVHAQVTLLQLGNNLVISRVSCLNSQRGSSSPQSQHRPLALAWQLQAVLLLIWGRSQLTMRTLGTHWSCQEP